MSSAVTKTTGLPSAEATENPLAGLSANWNASSGNQWTVPVGMTLARVFKVGAQPMNAQVGYFYKCLSGPMCPITQGADQISAFAAVSNKT